MKTPYFSGTLTALITPFIRNKPDFAAFERLIQIQLQNNVDGIVLFGTTGEGVSLSLAEKKALFLVAKRTLNNKIPIICGISSVNTEDAIALARFYRELKANGLLVCTPYYYKTTTQGIYKHFELIAKACGLPIIIYNVPARTNCDITKSRALLKKLEQNSQFVAIKQAGTNLESCKKLVNMSSIPLLCGNDKFMFELLKNGYVGSISVCSNVIPKQTKGVYEMIKEGNITKAELLFKEILPLILALELEPNPIPIKYASKLTCGCKPNPRLPLTTATKKTKQTINDLWRNYEITVN